MKLDEIFGGSAAKVIDYMINPRHKDESQVSIAQETGISYRQIHRIIPRLVKAGFLKPTRQVGKNMLFSMGHNVEIDHYNYYLKMDYSL